MPLALSTAPLQIRSGAFRLAQAEMVPMGEVEQALAAAARAADPADDVVGLDRLDRGGDLEAGAQASAAPA